VQALVGGDRTGLQGRRIEGHGLGAKTRHGIEQQADAVLFA
jgi:hypothetical protein